MNIFRTLPREVYECILLQLERMYLGCGGKSCSECYVRDLYSLSLTSRAWDRVVNPRMYRDLWVLGSNDDTSRAQVKIMGTSRLKLLRRTLRERPSLAQLVRNLHMPDFQDLYHNATIEREEIVNLVASLVMACPKLERLIGFHIPYTHSHDRLSYALSTRSNLRERVWYFSEEEEGMNEDSFEDDPSLDYYHAATDPTERFLELNSNHTLLTSLVLHQDFFRTSHDLNFRAIIGTLRQFPKLRDLSISGLSKTAFTNFTLNALPSNLLNLRLENLRGINDSGMERFSKSRTVKSLESITLINLEISRLDVICNFLHPRLSHLKRFSLVQYQTPLIPVNRGRSLRPQFHSPTLEHLHWEIRSQAGLPPSLTPVNNTLSDEDPMAHLTHLLLANSIKKGTSFPALQRIRIPHDPDGLVQAQCKPLVSALLPPDAILFTAAPRPAKNHQPISPPHTPKSHTSSFTSQQTQEATGARDATPPALKKPPPSPTEEEYRPMAPLPSLTSPNTIFTQFPHITALTPSRSRLAAQSRILAARKKVQSNDAHSKKSVHGICGDARSNVIYEVGSDREALGLFWDSRDVEDEDEMERNGWIVEMEDLVGRWEGSFSSEERRGKCGFGHSEKEGSGRGDFAAIGHLF
ncbi:hypothetical protein DM02DRAFT_680132 [Periconia macrospinosa]|uniref:F-box domain-containing protein n=1 Tax=Periconia macrospinosa TaxID=97972 RepID=A0A2V1DMG1_9PLEO|nr:hypothetical protein DM02DRAFT_680132 [Periconia macrospinosa]